MFTPSHRQRFEQVVRAYSNDLYRYLYWRCRDRGQAEDLVQETFARAWSAWAQQRDEATEKAWLFTIARNEHLRTFERQRPEVDPDADLDALVANGPTDPSLAIDMRKAFALLPEAFRDPLLMQVLGGLSSAEIAQAIGGSEDSVNMRLSRARKALRVLLEGRPTAGQTKESRS